MSTVQSTNAVAASVQPVGFMEWLRGLFLKLLGSVGENSIDPGGVVVGDADGVSESGEAFVLAPGGYRIRVPHPSDVGHSVGDMLPSVREGLSLLPPLPSVVLELLREIQDPKSTASSVAEVASSDPALAASLLRTANGAAMGLSRTITSVSEAVSYLGFGTVKAMVIRLRLDEVLMPKTEHAAQDAEDLWVHSLAVSYVAECLANRIGGMDAGFVATLGLLHDIGKLAILAQLPTEAAVLRTVETDEAANRLAREAKVLGLDHAGIGANLAAKWKLPADLVQAIRWHHRAAGAFHATDPAALRKATHVVQIANQLVKYCFPHADEMEIEAVADEAFALLGLEPSLAKLLDKPVRDAISRAIFFADGNSRRPAGAPRRFLRPLKVSEAMRVIASSPSSPQTIAEDDALIASLFTEDAPDLCSLRGSKASLSTIKHAVFKVPATVAGIQKCLNAIKAHQDELDLTTEVRHQASMTLKSLLPNLQSLAKSDECIEVAQLQKGRHLQLAVRTPGLASARRLGAPATSEATCRLADADLASLLNLGWFERIAISSDGAAITFLTR